MRHVACNGVYCVGVLYFVSTTVNPILYNVLSRKYRQAFKMTLCKACMDDATRQRLQRDGFGAFTVYYSAAPVSSANHVPGIDGDDVRPSRRGRMWGSAAATTAAAVVVGRTHLLSPVDSGFTTSSLVKRSPRGSTASVRYHNGTVNDSGRILFTATGGDGEARRQLGDHLVTSCRQTSEVRGGDVGSSMTKLEESNTILESGPSTISVEL